MKKQLLFITLLLIFQVLWIAPAHAQFFPPTGAAQVCSHCVPSQSYSIVSGTPYVSDRTFYGASASKWYSEFGQIKFAPAPPSSADPDAINNSSQTFLTLMKGPNLNSKVKFTVSNFIPGQKYKLNYAVMASRTSGTTFGTQAIIEVQPSNSQVILATAVTDLSQAKYVWTEQQMEFTPTTTETVFVLSGNVPAGLYGMINFDISAKPLECILPVNKQVVLTHPTQEIMYPCQTLDLNSYVKLPWPVGADVVWGYSSGTQTQKLTKQATESAGIGKYYAFYYHAANACYSLEDGVPSTAEVEVIHVPKQVPLKIGSNVAVKCPETQYNLENKLLYPSDSPNVRWFGDNKHQGPPISTITAPGTYYAFYYDASTDCYSTATSTSWVSVSFQTPCCKAGTDQVTVQPSTITNACPKSTADLTTTTLNFNVPLNTDLVWFDNPNHTGTKINDPTIVGPGIYYAFIYDPGVQCYNTNNSTAQVKVDITPCLNNVQLSIKAALQGSMSAAGSKMRNDLQTYNGTGLLPTSSPYPVAATSYPSINNAAGVVGEVVDWVLVEIRSGTNPQTVLQSATLLLKPDGTMVSRNGQTPTFNPQSGSVRIAVKHRNHLAIMSNPIQNFSAGSTVNYDFTTALSQASNAFGDPPQMVQKNGVWCMWAGDVGANQNMGIDASDMNGVYDSNKQGSFDTYIVTDVNMDGGVDANDRNLLYLSNLTGSISTIINY